MGFTKLDDGIIYSSIMGEDDSVFRVWIILLASCKSTGISPLSAVFIKNISGKSLEEVNRCLNILSKPDTSSRSTNDEGRRIRRVDGGFEIINYHKYRDFSYSDSPDAIKKRKQRDKKGHVPDISGHSASASASASSEGVQGKPKIPENMIPVEKDFREYLNMRKSQLAEKRKAPDTDYTIEVCAMNLIQIAGSDVEKRKAVLRQSIRNSWLDLFEIKENRTFRQDQQQPKPIAPPSLNDVMRRQAAERRAIFAAEDAEKEAKKQGVVKNA